MEIKNVQHTQEKKAIRLNLKTTFRASKWMKENNVSPQLVFDEGIKELMVQKKTK